MPLLRLSILTVLLLGCGAKTAVETSSPDRDAGLDAGSAPTRPDARVLPDGARPDARACPESCDDGVYCNGTEYCEERTGTCHSGVPASCDDLDECTVDRCDLAADACLSVPVDRDEDGDGVSACEGDCDDGAPLTFPGAAERCDMVDNDCDGRVDEGALSECGDCRPGCAVVEMPEDVAFGVSSETSAGVELTPGGQLVLSTSRTEFAYAWIANTAEGTLTRIDTRDGTQAGEYDSVLNGPGTDARPADELCRTESRGGNCPSRTAVDLRGSVYVANRAFFAQGTVSKIAGVREDCVDRDGDGRVETSEDQDGDGVIERDVDGEYLGQQDECLLWTVDVGGEGSVPRAIAVAADGTLWVGLHGAQRVLQLSADDGRVLRTINLTRYNFSPYGAAIAGDGALWLVEAATGRIMSINTSTGAIGPPTTVDTAEDCTGSYGIAVDGEDRVWLAGFQCKAAFRYDPADRNWFAVPLPDSGAGRGIAVDDRGYVYMAASHEWIGIGVGAISVGDVIARVTRFRADDGGDIRIFGTPDAPLPGLSPVGVGLDHDRNVWLVNQDSGTATVVDAVTGDAREFEVGDGPYTYSDFTGFALRTFTAPSGYVRTVVEGCPVGPTDWEMLRWDATEPRRTHVEVRVRAAPTRSRLASVPWTGPFRTTPTELTAPPGPVTSDRYLEVEVTLVSDDDGRTPRVRNVSVQYNCPI